MNTTYVKLIIGAVLFATWVLLVVLNVPNAADLINTIKLCLGALGAHTLTMVNPAGPSTDLSTKEKDAS